MLLIVVGGPAGTGKTTLAEKLRDELKCPFIEGDLLHPKANVDKMSQGIPLTDEDRWGWLKTLSEVSTEKGLSDPSQMCIVSCSMLKRSYRKYISKVASTVHEGNEFRFVFLYTTIEELVKRVGNRKGHFMKSDMVTSQYKIMEIPLEDELVANGGNSLAIDTTGKDIDEVFEGVRKEFIREGIDH